MKVSRNLCFGLIKDIAIIMVVGIHIFLSTDAGSECFWGSCNSVIRQLLIACEHSGVGCFGSEYVEIKSMQ